jgi:ABC-type sugar transport system substrate-binding protein
MKLYKLGILGLAGVAVLSGCSPKTSSPTAGANSSALVFFSQANESDAWHKLYQVQLDDSVKKHASDFKFEEVDAGGDAKKQSQQIEDAIAKKPAVLMVSPVSPDVAPAINKAHDAGIKVFLLDSKIDKCKADYYVGGSNHRTGIDALTLYARDLGKRRTGPVVIVPGVKGDPTDGERLSGVHASSIHDKVKVILGPFCNDSESEAKSYIAGYLKSNPAPDAILCITDKEAIGAGEAVKEAKASTQYIYGIGACSKQCFDALRAGTFYGSVYTPPAGPNALDMVPDLLQGKMPPGSTPMGTDLVRQDTLDRFFQMHPEMAKLN